MVSGIPGASGAATSVFNTPGVRPAEPATQQGQPARPVETVRPEQQPRPQTTGDTQAAQAAQPVQSAQPPQVGQPMNTAPTERQREEAMASGQTRGSFVDIRA